ncbi:intron-binding protein aquarius [Sodiomyces alkalinus F11]|uniref:Pre-mRNA-splicing factor n=1 Tax=Sodiomyces alkalinus (strain CBS 110278 / VKM F-3762 / F11) TaxID=1314773 RepID=A0A3N2Q837_SODAK|nr:intron-binding protein aquarius [Sodiomyces alkalinus F11]ROT42795.1 intron-binding protein aquarius [Sodiomyces alkalinus F11]
MPTAKRQKKSGNAPAASQTKAQPKRTGERPTVADIEGESEFTQLARKHWLKPTKKVKVKNDVIKKEIWEVLERDSFPYKTLLVLEGLQTLESYLWPGYTDESSNHHVLLIVLLTNVKRREQLTSWSIFEDRSDAFSDLFRRILSMTLDQTLSLNIRTQLLSFLISAFQSLDHAIVRKECAPLLSISIWHNLSTDALRETKLEHNAHVRKAWRASLKRYEAADEATKARLRFERSWLYTLVLDFLSLLYEEDTGPEHVVYCERFIEFLTDLLSQLPTRRYVNTLLTDLNVLPAMQLSPMLNDENNGLVRDLHSLFAHYVYFTIDDQTGVQFTQSEAFDKHCAVLGRLQKMAIKHFPEQLKVLALSNFGAIDKREELKTLLEPLTDEELMKLANLLHLRTSYPDTLPIRIDRNFLVEVFLWTFERRKTFQEVAREMNLAPTEDSLFASILTRAEAYDGSHPLALPKLNLQYLSVGDFLWRSLILYRSEAFYGIRKDIETVIKRLRPESKKPGETEFPGFSKMALPSSKVSIMEVVPPLVGDDNPSVVRAEVSVDVRRLKDNIRREWDSLRPDDVVFLLAIEPPISRTIGNGAATSSEADRLGIVAVRTAEIIRITDDKGRPVRDTTGRYGGNRIFQLKLDSQTYAGDAERISAGKSDVYGRINLIMRRSGRENNFKPVLQSIRSLVLSDVPLASWLHEVFLGYGDPAGASYKQLPNKVRAIDYRDTFIDWQHLIESLPGKIIEPSDDASGSFGPPYVLESTEKPAATQGKPSSKKRRRDAEPALLADVETLKVSTYKPPNTGPYPTDAPKRNTVRFTPAQIDAIISGSQPGLTIVVGPPGTGKTDVATQIISNIYHNFPQQKTLLIAHSNQALNQLFAKIVALDIDERHLLRLGHGEEDLYTEGSFSKHGRVESFLDNRNRYLQEVQRLAASMGAPGAHGNSAETAGYFNAVYVETAWTKFTNATQDADVSPAAIIEAFPFHEYFSTAPQPLFPADADRETVMEIAQGCYRHISKIFSELADVMPFEILRRDRDKANYLLTNEARIIAMTSTHAAMKREEIASLGFRYDNVVMEEAAQITEIENFLPLAMQKPVNGEMPLQRVVLCGDHFQNSPIIQSHAFRHYANLEQSLYSRLVRLGVPTINLDQQGRARPSIASLYQWRYPNLGNLPHVRTHEEFSKANAGFKYDYQFINVPDYKGRGEAEPSPHFIQNLGEAEYAVAIYQYMRLLGYPASKISILATYSGQRALIKDVLAHRCSNSAVFGQPRVVTTVDKYQGEQNDYIILSLTRTSRVGFLRDIRRMTVALSRARLGLYILGRREVFEACFELRQAFEQLLARPDKLMLVTGELWPSRRDLASEQGEVPGEACMEGVEHLGQYVFEMTRTKIQQLQSEGGGQGGELEAIQEAPAGEDGEGLVEPAEDEEVEEVDGPGGE